MLPIAMLQIPIYDVQFLTVSQSESRKTGQLSNLTYWQ